jgi:hypothetical protein
MRRREDTRRFRAIARFVLICLALAAGACAAYALLRG